MPPRASEENDPLLGSRSAASRPAGVSRSRWHYWCGLAKENEKSTGQSFWEAIGSIQTFLAMIPQGGFGMLLIDFLLLHKIKIPPARVASDLAFFIGSEEGKRQLIQFLNGPSWSGLAQKSWKDWISLINPLEYSILDVVILLMSINASMVFGGLAVISSRGLNPSTGKGRINGMSDLVLSYFSSENPKAEKIAKIIARVFESRGWTITFFQASFLANLLTFPGLHRMFLSTLKEFLFMPFISPQYRDAKSQWHEKVEAIRLYLKHMYETKNFGEHNRVLQSLLTNSLSAEEALPIRVAASSFDATKVDIVFEDVKSNMVTNARTVSSVHLDLEASDIDTAYKQIAHYKPSGTYNFFRTLANIVALGATGIGLFNFKDFGGNSAQATREVTHIPVDKVPDAVTGWMMFVSMSLVMNLVVLFTFGTIGNVFDLAFGGGRHRPVNVLNKLELGLVLALTFGISVLSGGPNAYQALSDGESPLMTIFAYVACIFLESMGIWNLMNNWRAGTKDEATRRVVSADQALTALSNQFPDNDRSPSKFREGVMAPRTVLFGHSVQDVASRVTSIFTTSPKAALSNRG